MPPPPRKRGRGRRPNDQQRPPAPRDERDADRPDEPERRPEARVSVREEPDPTQLAEIPDLDTLSQAQRRSLTTGELLTTPFEAGDGLFADWASGKVFDHGEPNARGIDAMLDSDGTARQLEQVLTLPLRAAEHALIGGSDRARKLVDEQLPHPQRTQVIAQQTSAVAFRKAFFELAWEIDGSGVRIQQPAFRPATSCQTLHDKYGRPDGFRQRVHNPGNLGAGEWARMFGGQMPGWIPVPKTRAHVYTHGTHRQPIKGISDLSVAWWAYETRRKLLYLWLQYLELHAQPKVAVFGKDMAQARRNVAEMRKLRAGGFVPVERPDEPSAQAFALLETAGSGAQQFKEAAAYLEQHMTDSVLAGFTKLSTNAGSGGQGSYALSTDASQFFLQSRQAVADEQAGQFTADIIAPICIYNQIEREDVPRLRIGPLTRAHVEQSLEMMTTLLTAAKVNAPDEFLDGLLTVVAPTLGLDADKLGDAIERYRADQERERAEMAEQMASLDPGAIAPGPPGKAQPGQPAARMTPEDQAKAQQKRAQATAQAKAQANIAARRGAPTAARTTKLAQQIDGAYQLVTDALATGDPDGALDRMLGELPVARRHIDLASPTSSTPPDEDVDEDHDDGHTGGMIALLPDAGDAANLLVDDGETGDQLHLTLCYLGDDVTGWSPEQRDHVIDRTRQAARRTEPIEGRVFGRADFNPDTDDACAVYLVGGSDRIGELNRELRELASALQHPGFVAHITAGYGLDRSALTYTGPVRFSRIVVALGDHWTEIPLTGGDRRDLEPVPG